MFPNLQFGGKTSLNGRFNHVLQSSFKGGEFQTELLLNFGVACSILTRCGGLLLVVGDGIRRVQLADHLGPLKIAVLILRSNNISISSSRRNLDRFDVSIAAKGNDKISLDDPRMIRRRCGLNGVGRT